MFLVVLMKDSNGKDVWFSHIVPDEAKISELKDVWLLGDLTHTIDPSNISGTRNAADLPPFVNRTAPPQPLPAHYRHTKKKPMTKAELRHITKKINEAKNIKEIVQ